jgi:hypothetical protein
LIDGYPLDFKPDWEPVSESYLQYAEVYKDTVQFILKKYSEEPPIHDYALAPLLFLLRQYIELQLKGIIFYGNWSPRVEGNHDIVSLYSDAMKSINQKYGTEALDKPNSDVEKFIHLLGKFDHRSQAFRYPVTREGEEFCKKIEKMDTWLYERITFISWSFRNCR